MLQTRQIFKSEVRVWHPTAVPKVPHHGSAARQFAYSGMSDERRTISTCISFHFQDGERNKPSKRSCCLLRVTVRVLVGGLGGSCQRQCCCYGRTSCRFEANFCNVAAGAALASVSHNHFSELLTFSVFRLPLLLWGRSKSAAAALCHPIRFQSTSQKLQGPPLWQVR